jgi:hypothetical protein
MVRSLNYHLEAQHHYPQYKALQAMGAQWSNEDQMDMALVYAIADLDNILLKIDVSSKARFAANMVLKMMVQEAGLVQVRERGERVWRKPDPAYLDQPVAPGVTVADPLPQTTFEDPADVGRAEREQAQDTKSAQLRAAFELACRNLKEIDLPEGLTLLDVMYMVGTVGSHEAARRLGVDRDTLQNRWVTFQRRVARILEVTNE